MKVLKRFLGTLLRIYYYVMRNILKFCFYYVQRDDQYFRKIHIFDINICETNRITKFNKRKIPEIYDSLSRYRDWELFSYEK